MDDPRCCGTGTCIIDAGGRCWCGQQWDGTQMCFVDKNDGQAHGAGATPPAQTGSEPGSGRAVSER